MQLNTVNVIEFGNHSPTDILSLASFSDDEIGNREAEDLFYKKMLENAGAESDVTAALDDGYFCDGTYTLLITHSTIGRELNTPEDEPDAEDEKAEEDRDHRRGLYGPENPGEQF